MPFLRSFLGLITFWWDQQSARNFKRRCYNSDMEQGREKKTRWVFVAAVLVSFTIFSCGGTSSIVSSPSSSESISAPTFSVYLPENKTVYEIHGNNPVEVKRGEDAVFELSMIEKYVLTSVTYKGEDIKASITVNNDGITKVLIPDIRYSMMLDVSYEVALDKVSYYPNGGTYIDGSDSSKPFVVGYSLTNRLRPNSEIGTNRISREGYVLKGWNTKEDGSGTEVGLGSRFTVASEGDTALFAQWEKESDKDLFTYSLVEDEIVIESYLGNESKVTVPSSIDGYPVTSISANAFHGDEQVVIFPSTILEIAPSAFNDSHVKEIYFYDNIESISDNCFENCTDFSTIHINAILAPRYGRKNLHSEINLADKYDILILNADKKKVVVFGGSGTYLSNDTKQMEEELGGEYVCLNLAVNGWFNGVAQFEMIMPYLRDGDVFLHTPETSSQFSFMYGTSMAPEIKGFVYNKYRFYSCLESNYDLLSLVDFRHVDYLLTAFGEFNKLRKSLSETSYTDYLTTVKLYGKSYQNDLGYIDDRGNWALPRPAMANPSDSGEADVVLEYVQDETAHTRLNSYYRQMREKGVSTFFSTAPINQETLAERLQFPERFDGTNASEYLYYGRPEGIPKPNYKSVEEWVSVFERAVTENLDITVIAPLSKTLYSMKDFFEPDYHLSDNAVPLYTEIITNGLKLQGFGK